MVIIYNPTDIIFVTFTNFFKITGFLALVAISWTTLSLTHYGLLTPFGDI